MGERLTTGTYDRIEEAAPAGRYRDNIRKKWEKRGISEEEYYAEIINGITGTVGPLSPWQQFYILAALSGRRMEWSQTRAGSHYHLVGLPCSICSRS